MTTTYYDLNGNIVKPAPQAPRQPWRPPAGTIVPPEPVEGRAAISTVTARGLDAWLADATPDEIVAAIEMEEAATKPRATIIARLETASKPSP